MLGQMSQGHSLPQQSPWASTITNHWRHVVRCMGWKRDCQQCQQWFSLNPGPVVVFLQVWMQLSDAKNCRWPIIRIPIDSYYSTACHDMHQGFWLPLISITQKVSCTEAFDTWQTVEQQKAPWGSRVNVQGIQDLRITIYTCSSDVKKI